MDRRQFPFNEADVRRHYLLLNHKYVSELRFLKRGMYPVCRIVKCEDSLVELCRQWNGRRNVYVGLRDRREGLKSCAKSEDIIGLQSVVLDIDPIRKTEISSTAHELNSSIEMGKEMKKWFAKNGFNNPYIAVTGNGCCLYFSLPSYKIGDKDRFYITHKIEAFEDWVRNNFRKDVKRYNCTIDRMYDLPRIIRVVGTYNIKGKSTTKRPHRLSYWLEKPKAKDKDKKLLKFILSL